MAGKTALRQHNLYDSINQLIVKEKLDQRNSQENVMMSCKENRLGVNVEYTYDVDQKKIDKIVRAIDRKY